MKRVQQYALRDKIKRKTSCTKFLGDVIYHFENFTASFMYTVLSRRERNAFFKLDALPIYLVAMNRVASNRNARMQNRRQLLKLSHLYKQINFKLVPQSEMRRVPLWAHSL